MFHESAVNCVFQSCHRYHIGPKYNTNTIFGGVPYYNHQSSIVMYCKAPIWEFPEIRGTLFRGPYNRDPTI